MLASVGMAKDASGNYVCGVSIETPDPPQSMRSGLFSLDVPSDDVGRDGSTCVVQSTGGFYAKILGVWRHVKNLF